MARPRHRRIGAAVTAAVATTCSCGGGVSTTDFIERADAICADANRRVEALGPEPSILTDEQARWVERVAEIGRGAVADLRVLRTPAGDRETIGAMLEGFDGGFAGADAIAAASRAGDDAAFRQAAAAALDRLQDGRSEASRYGLDACSRLGRVPSGTRI